MASKLERFLKKNKKVRENTTFAPTKSLTDENGEPLEFTLRPITTKENDKIRNECTREVPIPGRNGMYRYKTDASKYSVKLVVSSIVEPDLYNQELQDSYGVSTPEELVQEMIDNPGEFAALQEFIQKYNGFDDLNIEKEKEEAKK